MGLNLISSHKFLMLLKRVFQASNSKVLYLMFVFCLVDQNLYANGIYFPGKMDTSFRNKISSCESKSLPKFEYSQFDFLTENLKSTLTKLSQRSRLEGKERFDSLNCLRSLNLNSEEKKIITASLQDLFQVEIQLYQLYIRWLQSGMGLDAKSLESYFQSRYDLMVLIQTKTIQVWKEEDAWNDSETIQDFSNLYQSVHRAHFDGIYTLDPNVRERYFQLKEGNRQ